jgi:hypothetical protein
VRLALPAYALSALPGRLAALLVCSASRHARLRSQPPRACFVTTSRKQAANAGIHPIPFAKVRNHLGEGYGMNTLRQVVTVTTWRRVFTPYPSPAVWALPPSSFGEEGGDAARGGRARQPPADSAAVRAWRVARDWQAKEKQMSSRGLEGPSERRRSPSRHHYCFIFWSCGATRQIEATSLWMSIFHDSLLRRVERIIHTRQTFLTALQVGYHASRCPAERILSTCTIQRETISLMIRYARGCPGRDILPAWLRP